MQSRIQLPVICPIDYRLTLRIRPFIQDGRRCGFHIAVNGVNFGSYDCSKGLDLIEIDVRNSPLPPGHGITIDLFHVTADPPAEPSDGTGNRAINIAMCSIRMHPVRLDIVEFDAAILAIDRFTPYQAGRLQQRFRRELEAKNRLENDTGEFAVSRGIQFLLYGYCGNNHDRGGLAARIRERSGTDAGNNAAWPQGRMPRHVVERCCPNFAEFLMERRGLENVEILPMYPAGKGLAIENMMTSATADLLVNYRQFMIFDPKTMTYFEHCNPANLSRLSVPPQLFSTNRPIVVLQDNFDCGNIAHFLLDSCLRAYNFCIFKPEIRQRALFILGGHPTEFHKMMIAVLARLFQLNEDQFLFPRDSVRLRSSAGISWFTDHDPGRHPAQRWRPDAVAALQTIARNTNPDVARSSLPARIYISRADANLRRLKNEAEMLTLLGEFGFEKIIMSHYSWAEQVAIVANADMIVAPHGMALTMLTFNLKKPKIIELCHPTRGTDAYALLSRVYNNDYVRLVGREVDAQKWDFVVDVNLVRAALHPLTSEPG